MPLNYFPIYILLLVLPTPLPLRAASPPPSVLDNLTFSGQADPEQASFVLKGRLKSGSSEEQEPKLVYSLHSQATIQIEPTNITQACELKTRIFQGKMKELVLAMRGE